MNSALSDFLLLLLRPCVSSVSYTGSLFWNLDLDLVPSHGVHQKTCDIALLNCGSVGYFCDNLLPWLCLQSQNQTSLLTLNSSREESLYSTYSSGHCQANSPLTWLHALFGL